MVIVASGFMENTMEDDDVVGGLVLFTTFPLVLCLTGWTTGVTRARGSEEDGRRLGSLFLTLSFPSLLTFFSAFKDDEDKSLSLSIHCRNGQRSDDTIGLLPVVPLDMCFPL